MAVPPGPARGRKTIRRGPGQQIVAGQDFRLADEVRYIQRHAANHHRRMPDIGPVLAMADLGDPALAVTLDLPYRGWSVALDDAVMFCDLVGSTELSARSIQRI